MWTLFEIIAIILGAMVMIVLFLQNQHCKGRITKLKTHIEYLEHSVERVEEDKVDLCKLAQDRGRKLVLMHEDVLMHDDDLATAIQQRDDAMLHLEKTLVSHAAEHVSPDRVATEVGMDGVYYVFSYDPPEYAQITPLPQLTGSPTT